MATNARYFKRSSRSRSKSYTSCLVVAFLNRPIRSVVMSWIASWHPVRKMPCGRRRSQSRQHTRAHARGFHRFRAILELKVCGIWRCRRIELQDLVRGSWFMAYSDCAEAYSILYARHARPPCVERRSFPVRTATIRQPAIPDHNLGGAQTRNQAEW